MTFSVISKTIGIGNFKGWFLKITLPDKQLTVCGQITIVGIWKVKASRSCCLYKLSYLKKWEEYGLDFDIKLRLKRCFLQWYRKLLLPKCHLFPVCGNESQVRHLSGVRKIMLCKMWRHAYLLSELISTRYEPFLSTRKVCVVNGTNNSVGPREDDVVSSYRMPPGCIETSLSDSLKSSHFQALIYNIYIKQS